MRKGLPENVCCIGKTEKNKKVFVEQYVAAFLLKATERRTEPQMVVLYGDGYEKDGCRYYFLKGAASHRASGETFGKMDEFYFQNIGKKYFPGWKGIGWYYSGAKELQKDVLDILRNVCEQDFTCLNGYYVYYEKNPEMEEYMVSHEMLQKKEVSEQDDRRKERKEKKDRTKKQKKDCSKKIRIAPVQAMQILNMVSLCILIICCIIAVTTINQYDKMKRLEKTVNYLEASMEEQETSEKQKNLPEE